MFTVIIRKLYFFLFTFDVVIVTGNKMFNIKIIIKILQRKVWRVDDQCSDIVVSSVVDFMTDSILSEDVETVVVIAVVIGDLVSIMVSSLRSILFVIGRHS